MVPVVVFAVVRSTSLSFSSGVLSAQYDWNVSVLTTPKVTALTRVGLRSRAKAPAKPLILLVTAVRTGQFGFGRTEAVPEVKVRLEPGPGVRYFGACFAKSNAAKDRTRKLFLMYFRSISPKAFGIGASPQYRRYDQAFAPHRPWPHREEPQCFSPARLLGQDRTRNQRCEKL